MSLVNTELLLRKARMQDKLWRLSKYFVLLRMSYLHFDNKKVEKFYPAREIHIFTNLEVKTIYA